VVYAATHENAEVGAVVQASDAASMANESAQKIPAVEREASNVDLFGDDVKLGAKLKKQRKRCARRGDSVRTSRFSEFMAEHSSGSLLLV
jgi:hypothetical protein